MDLDQAKKIVKESVVETLDNEAHASGISDDMALIGGQSELDSMKLVELCLTLEDKADNAGFEFDWTSDAAMSRSRSMFRTTAALADEFFNQYQAQK